MHEWTQSIRVLYPFDFAPVYSVHKIDIKVPDVALGAAEPLTSPTKVSAPLIELNTNAVDFLTTTLATELSCKHRRVEATSDSQAERVPA